MRPRIRPSTTRLYGEAKPSGITQLENSTTNRSNRKHHNRPHQRHLWHRRRQRLHRRDRPLTAPPNQIAGLISINAAVIRPCQSAAVGRIRHRNSGSLHRPPPPSSTEIASTPSRRLLMNHLPNLSRAKRRSIIKPIRHCDTRLAMRGESSDVSREIKRVSVKLSPKLAIIDVHRMRIVPLPASSR